MWTRVRALLALAALTVAAPAVAGNPISGFEETVFQGSLNLPTAIAFLPDGRMLITEKGGALKLSNGSSVSTLITIPVCDGSEMGLLGVAVDPNFGSNGFVYLYRTKDNGNCLSSTGRFNEVVRITIGAGDTVNPSLLTVLVTGAQTDGGNHDGGCLRIGPDGKLYVGVGDTGIGDNQGGPGSSTNPYSQNLNVLMGKVLRINLDGTIPADNPFFGQVGKRGEIFAYGFRNPFRFSFDPLTGKLWLADVGDLTIEEIDIVTSGGNYGWPHCEGTLPNGCEDPGDIDPIFTYPHSGSSSLGGCIIGGGFAGGSFGGLDNQYFFGDCDSSNIYSAAPTGGAQRNGVSTPALFLSSGDTPSDMVFGPDGALYYVAESGGQVRRVAPVASGGDQPVFGSKLTLKDNATNQEKKSLTMQAKDGIVLGGTGDDPTTAASNMLEVVSQVPGAAFDQCYPLPAGNWTVIGNPADHKGFKYKDSKRLAGPVKSAQVKADKLIKVSGKGSALGFSIGATSPDPVTVILSTGARRYCATFGGETKFTASKSFSAKLANNPASCPPSNCP